MFILSHFRGNLGTLFLFYNSGKLQVIFKNKSGGMKRKIEADIAEMEGKGPDHFRGDDWFQLSADEEAVFAIERSRFPRMVVAWYAYQVLQDQVDCRDYDFDRQEVLAAQRHFKFKAQRVALYDFQTFAKEYAGLTYREAEAMFSKIKFWNIRARIKTSRDE